jgi:threonine/homoserine/homoserine lactone efflux protein
MQSSMTFTNIAALFGVLFVGALIPGVSVLAVAARSAAFGFIHGFFTTMGIVLGDIIFILLAIFGLSLLAHSMGGLFVLVKYLGGAYLIWLGIALWRPESRAVEAEGVMESSLLSSFLTGLFITLGDQKAILFYLGFFPAFLDLSTLSYFDAGIIILIAIVDVGGVKLGYAYAAERAGAFFKGADAIKRINIVAGTVMMGVGLFLVARAWQSTHAGT